MTPSPAMSPAEARRLADRHFVDRYDHAQLAALDRIDQLDKAGTPLVVPRGVNRVYRTEPTSTATRLRVVGPEFQVTRDTVLTLLDLGLAHSDHLVGVDSGQNRGGSDEQRTAYVLTATRRGRDVLDVAHRIGRLARPSHRHDRKATHD